MKQFSAVLLLLALVLFGGCASSDGGLLDTGEGSLPMGQVTVAIHDAPMPGLEEFFITLDTVRVRSDGEWIDLGLTTPWTQDLLLLQGEPNAMDIITGRLPAGDYDAVELTITDVHYTLSGQMDVLPLPAEGIVVTVLVDFTMTEDGEVTVNLHFDVEGSMRMIGPDLMLVPAILPSGVYGG